jgi:small-conductance mechanosensitive channel
MGAAVKIERRPSNLLLRLFRRLRSEGIKALRIAILAALALAILFSGSLSAESPAAIAAGLPDAQQVITYLNQTINWQRHLAVEEGLATEPSDAVFINDNRQLAQQVLRLSFDFARAAAQNASIQTTQPQNPDATQKRYQALLNAAQKADAQVRSAQNELAGLRQKLETAHGRSRASIRSQIDEVQSELELAQTRSETIRNILQFVGGKAASGVANGGLTAQVDETERSVPELAASNAKSAAGQPNIAAQPTQAANTKGREQPTGILGLIADLFSLSQKIRTIDQTIALTNALAQSSQKLRAPLVASLTAAAQKGDEVAAQDSTDPAVLERQKQELEAITSSFKQASALVLPLGKQSRLLEIYGDNLTRWRDTIKSQYEVQAKNLALRLLVLLSVLVVLIGLGEAWRRATFRYINDPRRRYQFLLMRRIVLWFFIAITIAFAFASEIGSLATFAGLITAGIAVALQNVILAVAGYFFLIGKYGVRVGDRVQISGVTGDVVDVGMFRLHLMEVAGGGSDRQPTGRVVVFSNAIVFQPTASFFKQIPGTSFVWHEVSLTLAPETDYWVAEKRMLDAVETVYVGYRDRIEHQHRQMERTLNMTVAVPRPYSRVRLTQSGLEVLIRYPIELDKAIEIDDRVTRELLTALQQKPKLKVVGSGAPNIQPVTDGAGTAEAPEGFVRVDQKDKS